MQLVHCKKNRSKLLKDLAVCLLWFRKVCERCLALCHQIRPMLPIDFCGGNLGLEVKLWLICDYNSYAITTNMALLRPSTEQVRITSPSFDMAWMGKARMGQLLATGDCGEGGFWRFWGGECGEYSAQPQPQQLRPIVGRRGHVRVWSAVWSGNIVNWRLRLQSCLKSRILSGECNGFERKPAGRIPPSID